MEVAASAISTWKPGFNLALIKNKQSESVTRSITDGADDKAPLLNCSYVFVLFFLSSVCPISFCSGQRRVANGASITRSSSRVMVKERMLSVCGDPPFDATAPYILLNIVVCVYGIAVFVCS